jgi:hypothetical protein
MKPGVKEYLKKAKEFETMAVATQSRTERLLYEGLARNYRKLATLPRRTENKAKPKKE